jgi:alginate O-acetyltransferase complex protein AlgI
MNFNTALFLFLFLPTFLIAYFFSQPRWRPVLGILASLLFYAWGDARNLVVLFGLILVNYFLGRSLVERERPERWVLPVGLLINVGVLAFFKFFIAYQFDLFLGLDVFLPERVKDWLGSFTFPLGLSYISFQLISYLVDVHRGSVKPERNLLTFAFYVLMFPKLLVGPIVRYRTLAEVLPAPQLDPLQIADGIRRFLRGFAKKILIADVLAATVNAVFDLPVGAHPPFIGWLALVGFGLQIYFDFSGLTDMAIGLAAMMGFRFIENFNYPYIAEGIGDFWRRWHISLSTWFRDYVFYPLERRRVPVTGQSLNILIVFLLTGLWHGVTISFIVWGLLHGTFIVLENAFLNRWLQKLWQPMRHAYAIAAILLTWLVFRSPDLAYAFDFLKLLFGQFPGQVRLPFLETAPLPFIEPSFLLALAAGIVLSIPIMPLWQARVEKSFPLTLASDLILLAAFVLSIGMMASSTFLPGIYERF